MYKHSYQSGPSMPIFHPTGTKPCRMWSLSGPVSRAYDKPSQGLAINLPSQGCKMSLPKRAKDGLCCTQKYLAVQVKVWEEKNFAVELAVTTAEGTRRRINVSTAFGSVKVSPLAAQMPLDLLGKVSQAGSWITLCFDMETMVEGVFPSQKFVSLDGITIMSEAKVRKIFTLRDSPEVEEIPHSLDFPRTMKVKAKVIMVGGGPSEEGEDGGSSDALPEPNADLPPPAPRRTPSKKLMSVMRSPKLNKPTVAFGYRVGAATGDAAVPEEREKKEKEKKAAVATKVVARSKEREEDMAAVREALARARARARERNIVAVKDEEEEEEEEEEFEEEEEEEEEDVNHTFDEDGEQSHSPYYAGASKADSSRFSVYADTPTADTPTADTPAGAVTPMNDNSHYSLPPSDLLPPAPPVPSTNQSFSNMLDTSPMQSSPGLHLTGGSRRSVLASIDDGVHKSQEFLRSYEEVWQENTTGSAPTTPNDNTMNIGVEKLRELQRELQELEESYETEYGDLSQSASNIDIELNPLCADEEKENTDPTSPSRPGPPTLDDEDDGLVLMRTGNFSEGNVLQEVSHDVVVEQADYEEVYEEIEEEVGADPQYESSLRSSVRSSESDDDELELVFVKEGVYQDPSTGKFYSLK